jgi:uncharacterized lipoprotein
MTFRRVLLFSAVAGLTAGCHMLRPNCRSIEDYQAARDAPALRVPAGMDSPDVKDVLKIPPATAVAPPAAAKDACLDDPPRFREAPKGVAAGG